MVALGSLTPPNPNTTWAPTGANPRSSILREGAYNPLSEGITMHLWVPWARLGRGGRGGELASPREAWEGVLSPGCPRVQRLEGQRLRDTQF